MIILQTQIDLFNLGLSLFFGFFISIGNYIMIRSQFKKIGIHSIDQNTLNKSVNRTWSYKGDLESIKDILRSSRKLVKKIIAHPDSLEIEHTSPWGKQ